MPVGIERQKAATHPREGFTIYRYTGVMGGPNIYNSVDDGKVAYIGAFVLEDDTNKGSAIGQYTGSLSTPKGEAVESHGQWVNVPVPPHSGSVHPGTLEFRYLGPGEKILRRGAI